MPDADPRMLIGLIQTSLTREPSGNGRTGIPVAWASTRGTVREENQDRVLVARGRTGLVVAVLADGMGGMAEGARAAALAASAAAAWCLASPEVPLERLLREALNFANDEVFATLRGAGGAAMVLAARSSTGWWVAHAGDARAYKLEGDGKLRPLTADDTVKAQLRDLGRSSAQTSRLDDQLLQFIGAGKDFDPHVSRIADGGRGLLLTSDGVHELPPDVMEWIVKGAGHLHLVADRLVVASEWAGGHDNGTVVAISLANGYAATPIVGLAEFWLPGGHLVVVPQETRPGEVVRLPEQVAEPKPRSKRGRERKQAKRIAPSSVGRGAPKQRQLPIVEFGGAAAHGSRCTTFMGLSPHPA